MACYIHCCLHLFFTTLAHTASLYCEKHAYIDIYSDRTESVYELLLLPNDNASETFLHKSGEVRSVDWIFITGVPAWRRMGEYVTPDIP